MQQEHDLFSKTDEVINELSIPHQWPSHIESQLTAIGDSVTKKDLKGRIDLRNKPFITIDGEDARDFDDAVYCYQKDNCFHLSVAIADVSHYIEPQSPLDKEALLRSTSIYFPHQVIPMLPEKLSNGLCSLNPNVDRLVFVVDMVITDEGVMTNYHFYNAVINSHARLTYNEVSDYLLNNHALDNKVVTDNIDQLFNVYQALLKSRQQRGAMEFETNEMRFVLSNRYKIKDVVPIIRNDAHRLIEEAMLAANYCAADQLLKLKQPGLFRNHLAPELEKIELLRHFLRTQGLILTGGGEPKPADFQKLSAKITNHPNAKAIVSMMLRSQQQAHYHPQNQGHFGLSLERYTHFTSPIRRYPDLMVHRALRSTQDEEALNAIAEQCSINERRAEDASRQITQWLKCDYLKKHIGDTLEGTIVAVTNFGLFVSLDDIHIEGLIHISNLDSDYYDYDATTHCLRGRRSQKEYSMGKKLSVKVAGVNVDELKIDFMPAQVSAVKRKKDAANVWLRKSEKRNSEKKKTFQSNKSKKTRKR